MSARVYIGRLARDVREKDVENFFKGYGRVIDISLKEGFGFINFEEHRDAEDAVYDLNGKELCGERVVIEHARSPGSKRREMRGSSSSGFRGQRGGYRDYGRDSYGRDSYGRDRGGYGGGGGYREFRPRNPPPQRTDNRILIENLSSRVSWQDLKDLMKKVGDVTFADAHKIRPGDGVVEFASSSDVKKAIEKYDGYELEGKKMRVKDGRKSNRKSRSRSYSRSQSRSRSSSRSRGRNSDSRHKDRNDRDRSTSKDSKPRSHGRNNIKNSDNDDRNESKRQPRELSASPQAKYARSRSHSHSDDNN